MTGDQLEELANSSPPIKPTRSGRCAKVVSVADVEPVPVDWLWPGRFALGKLAIVAGNGGLGKSFVTLDMAARVSRGLPWPDRPNGSNPPGGVVLLSGEDDLADTIRPRLDRAGADVSRIDQVAGMIRADAETTNEETVPSQFHIGSDLDELDRVISERPDCRLVIVDPISAFLGDVNSHSDAAVRSVLAPLAAIAMRHHTAVVVVAHLNKGSGQEAIHRVTGSVGFVAAARSAWIVIRDPHDHERRLMLLLKNNVGHEADGLAYTIVADADDDDAVAHVAWDPTPVTMSADDAMEMASRGGSDDRNEAEEILREILADGPVAATEALASAKEAGLSDKRTRAAFKAIGAKRRRVGFGEGGQWTWELPHGAKNSIDGIDSPLPESGIYGNNGRNGAATPPAETEA